MCEREMGRGMCECVCVLSVCVMGRGVCVCMRAYFLPYQNSNCSPNIT